MGGDNERKYFDRVRKTVGRAINVYDLIRHGDRVAVPVSGGKDSFVLLETLAERRRFIPVNYEVMAVHVRVANIPYEMDDDFFTARCASLEVPLYRMDVSFTEEEGKSLCFLCSWHRRKALFRFAGEHRCNRLALGHHKDDAIETLFLNLFYQGSISSMPAKLPVFGGEFDIIRPLILLTNDEVARYAALRNFPGQKKNCPFSEKNRREDIRKLLQDVYRDNGKARDSIFRAMSNIHIPYLPNGGGHS